MKKRILALALGLLALTFSSFGAIVGLTDPGAFTGDTIDWCQFGCAGAQVPVGSDWASSGTSSGQVGNVGTLEPSYNLQQGTSWNGDFPGGMGLIYNGANFGNTPTEIALAFDQAQQGFGAYIQPDMFGDFTATITLYDINEQVIGSYTTNGTSTAIAGTALFLGAYDSLADVWAVSFAASAIGDNQPDIVAIGQGRFYSAVPEPGSMVLMGSALIGLAALLRRRRS
jgi:hypothetical protein